MSFPVESTSVETAATKRLIVVLQRLEVAKRIHHAGVFACRKISGSSAWSDHSWGAAADIFPKAPTDRDEIAHAIVWQATHRTKANRFRKLSIRYVIDHDGRAIWTPSEGWHAYGGAAGNHVHASTGKAPVGVPPCA